MAIPLILWIRFKPTRSNDRRDPGSPRISPMMSPRWIADPSVFELCDVVCGSLKAEFAGRSAIFK